MAQTSNNVPSRDGNADHKANPSPNGTDDCHVESRPIPATPDANTSVPSATVHPNDGSDPTGVPTKEVSSAQMATILANAKAQKSAQDDKKVEAELEALKRQYELFPTRLFPQWAKVYVYWAAAFVIAVLGWLILVQFVQYYAVVRSLPRMEQSLFWIGFAVFSAIILFIIGKIGWFLYRLDTSPNIAVHVLKQLDERRKCQQIATKEFEEAQKTLKTYLKRFKFDKEMHKTFVETLLLSEEEYEKLRKEKTNLLGEKPWEQPKEWIYRFQSDFQKTLDTLATKRINRYYWAVFSGTALSPRALVDYLIVITATISMIHDLLRIYQVKPAPGRSLLLLSYGFFNVYISGHLQEKAEGIIGEVATIIKEQFAATKGIGIASFSILKPIAAKLSEGMLNALLLQKLGNAIKKQLQPTIPVDVG